MDGEESVNTVECKLMQVQVLHIENGNVELEVRITLEDGSEISHIRTLRAKDTLNLTFGDPNGKYHFAHPRKFLLSPQQLVEGSK